MRVLLYRLPLHSATASSTPIRRSRTSIERSTHSEPANSQTVKGPRHSQGPFSPGTYSVMPEQCEQYYDGERHSQKPKQRASSKSHDYLLLQ